jgi:hypothetical protein
MNIKFRDNQFNGTHVVPHRRKDRHDEVNSSFSQFCERVKRCHNLTLKKKLVTMTHVYADSFIKRKPSE